MRCPIHGIAYDDELEQCPECAKGATHANTTSAAYLRVRVRRDRLTPTERARFEGKTYTITWDKGTLSGDPAAVELLESEAAIRGLAGWMNPLADASSAKALVEDLFEIIEACGDMTA